MVASAKILAVDDEPDFELLIRQRFRRQIRDEEFEFRFAHHGEEALAALSAEPDIELMLLDINMPVMDGLTLLNELRERQLEVQAIIVSAYGDMTNLRTAMNRGAFDFVTKPVDLSDLEITVRKALANVAKLREMDRQRMAAERARNNLSRYFSPNIVELLAAQDEPLGAGRRETVAVLFADIVAFTRMAEVMAPEDVLALLREFHTRMTAQIFASGGTVDQYMGDGIIAVFGAPAASPNDAANALNCAEMMLEALERWNHEREAEGRRPARYRHRSQLRTGRAWRCRQRTQHVVHRDRGYGQHGGATAGADPLTENAVGCRGCCCSGDPGIVPGNRRGAYRPIGGSRRT